MVFYGPPASPDAILDSRGVQHYYRFETGGLMKALAASFIVVLLGCGPAARRATGNYVPPGTFTITAEQIEKSGARTAWQVLKQQAPMLQTRDDRNGRPASLGRRGRASLPLDAPPGIPIDRL